MRDYLNKIYQQFLVNQGPILDAGLKILGILLIGIGVWWFYNLLIRRLEKRCREQPFFEKNQNIFGLLRRAGHSSILILIGVGLISLTHSQLIERIFFAMMIIILASFANTALGSILPTLEEKLTSRTASKFDDVILDLLKRFATVLIFVTAGILALDVLGVNIMPFIAGAGVAGIAIGFAAKDTLSNVIAGVLLILDRPFEVGDRIEVWSAPANSATWGDVLHIGLRATKIRTTDNIVIVIPNNEIMMRDIINYTTHTSEIRVRIPIGIAYDSDVKKAKEIIANIALELDWVMEQPAPKVVVKSFGDSSVNLEARVWIQRPRKRMDTISHITDRVKEEFHKEGIEIPYPKRDIYVKTGEFQT
jgi:small-conductance mechanosensitive channel